MRTRVSAKNVGDPFLRAVLGFCHGKNYFCRDSGKKPVKTMSKTGKIKDTIN